jgi:hypothetical protein
VWQGRRRLAQLEKEVAQARAERAELQRRMDMFEQIAAAAGASLDEEQTAIAAGDGSVASDVSAALPAVPATLLAAAKERRQQGAPVRLAVGGRDVIAVIGDEGGDPREWWTAIRSVASRLRSAS